MDNKAHHSVLAEKSGSFSGREEKKIFHRPSRNLSMNYIRSHIHFGMNEIHEEATTNTILEEEGEGQQENKDCSQVQDHDNHQQNCTSQSVQNHDLISIVEEVDVFLSDSVNHIPYPAIEALAVEVEKEIERLQSGDDENRELTSLIGGIDRIHKINVVLVGRDETVDRTSVAVQKAMAFLEDELRSTLEEETHKPEETTACRWTPPDKEDTSEADRGCIIVDDGDIPTLYSPEVVGKLRSIAEAMVSAGYEAECYHTFILLRRNAVEMAVLGLGFEKESIDEVQKMGWEALEAEITTWTSAFKQCTTSSFSLERELCRSVFSGQPSVELFTGIVGGVVMQLVNFAEAVAITKRSAEKLFKFLDMYEALRDFTLVSDEEKDEKLSELVMELSTAKLRLGEAAVRIFGELETSIKSDTTKGAVPGGAVHPLTRYVMNYVKYVCEYKNTLVQVFEDYQKLTSDAHENESSTEASFATEMTSIMDLLDRNLEAKSKQYKDISLSYIFLMNNGRYIMQKIKDSPEIKELLGETWCRKRSSDLRQYHKSYQRETWGKVLGCLRDEGLHNPKGNGIVKPALKERFKSFNGLFDEIHKTQSTWVVSDEQLQSELRVSISAVVVPAYRSFLGRFQQYLDPGRQTEKYIKFGSDELENYIEELFDGNINAPPSIIKRRP